MQSPNAGAITTLFLLGVASQVLAAFVYKSAMWYLYVKESNKVKTDRAVYKIAEWLSVDPRYLGSICVMRVPCSPLQVCVAGYSGRQSGRSIENRPKTNTLSNCVGVAVSLREIAIPRRADWSGQTLS